MNTENAIAFLKVDEMVATGGCDYCDKPTGRRFIRYDEWEWQNQAPERKFRSIPDENSWDSKYDNPEKVEPIIGKQHQVHYHVCEKCLLLYADKLFKIMGKYIGTPESWYRTYMNEQKRVQEIRKTQVGMPINMEKVW